MTRINVPTVLSGALALLIGFAMLAQGAHDIWSASIVYLVVLLLLSGVLLWTAWSRESAGFQGLLIIPILIIGLSFWASFHHSVNPGESLVEVLDWSAAFLLF